jgi:hypothetical protein
VATENSAFGCILLPSAILLTIFITILTILVTAGTLEEILMELNKKVLERVELYLLVIPAGVGKAFEK